MVYHVLIALLLFKNPIITKKLSNNNNLKNTSAAVFRFMPRFKAQTEGSIVYYSHSLRIESIKQRGYYVHISDVPYSPIPDWRNSTLPKSLQNGKIFEANLATAVDSTHYAFSLLFKWFCLYAHTYISLSLSPFISLIIFLQTTFFLHDLHDV
jgi:hypothetical protein